MKTPESGKVSESIHFVNLFRTEDFSIMVFKSAFD